MSNNQDDDVVLNIAMSRQEARAYAQFLKRVGHSDYLRNAVDSDEAYTMLYAGERIRYALADVGYAPR